MYVWKRNILGEVSNSDLREYDMLSIYWNSYTSF